jgi:hypothetical protein
MMKEEHTTIRSEKPKRENTIMQNVINISNANQSKPKVCNVAQYETQNMNCPVTKARECYFVPLEDINGLSHNPGRAGGTNQTAVEALVDSLVSPKGQLEPICLEWNPEDEEYDIVFGYHREWAIQKVYELGNLIDNHPTKIGVPGVWAWIFKGNAATRTALQMRENGNKPPGLPASKQQMVDMLKRYIAEGGLDKSYPEPFDTLTDKGKHDRAKRFMKDNTPYWGYRRFEGVWNKLNQDGTDVIKLNYTTYSKEKVVDYFCNNNPYGIQKKHLKKGAPSGSVVEINNKIYGVYFVVNRTEPRGALPTNACWARFKNNIDHMIVVAALNNSSTGRVSKDRDTVAGLLRHWNANIPKEKTFDEVFWMPQTNKEKNAHIMKGEWAKTEKL